MSIENAITVECLLVSGPKYFQSLHLLDERLQHVVRAISAGLRSSYRLVDLHLNVFQAIVSSLGLTATSQATLL